MQHPKPTHPPFQVPDPPVTPNPVGSSADATPSDPHVSSARSRVTGGTTVGGGASGSSNPAGYARYSSPPIKAQTQQNFGNFSSSDPYGQSVQGQMGGGGGIGQQSAGASFGNFGGFGFGGQQGDGGPNLLNDHTAQMGVHLGRQMAQAGGEYMEKNVSTTML